MPKYYGQDCGLWWSKRPIETAVAFWKLNELLVINRLIQLGFYKNLQHAFFLTKFWTWYLYKDLGKYGSESFILKSLVIRNFS